ncbi:MAG TPA: sulfatase-like hydrolase/transferase [Candidatus Cybelea sp.]
MATDQPSNSKPNIVFILVDNVGWGDFGVYGGQTPTPRIDKLASEGVRFNNYNVEIECTPSRSAIMTGRMPVRSGTSVVTFGVPYGLAPFEYTVAQLLSDAGYATALYGKWHLGDVQGRFPSDKGFDEWWGRPNTWDEAGYTSYPLFKESGMKPPMLMEGKKGQPSTPAMPLDLSVRGIVDEKYLIPKTIDFIQRNAAAKKPFFVYLGYSEVHPPIVPNPNFADKSTQRGGLYSDIIGEMDFRVGQVLDAIEGAGIADNTLVVLSSDNGTSSSIAATPGGSSGPWREISSLRRSKAAVVPLRSYVGRDTCLPEASPMRCWRPRTGYRRSPASPVRRISSPRTARSTASMPQRSFLAKARPADAIRLCCSVTQANCCQSNGRSTR